MPRTGRPGLTHREKRELWHRWKAGQTLSEIGHALNKHAGSVHGVLSVTGGIEPRPRKRSSHALQLHEREEVSRGLGRGFSFRRIAKLIGRSASTISRERIVSNSSEPKIQGYDEQRPHIQHPAQFARSGISQRMNPIRNRLARYPISGPVRADCIWPLSSICTPAASSVGRCQ